MGPVRVWAQVAGTIRAIAPTLLSSTVLVRQKAKNMVELSCVHNSAHKHSIE